MSKEKKIFVERETYTKNDKEFFTYLSRVTFAVEM